MAEQFVKTIKKDYITLILKLNVRTVLLNPAAVFTHDNENQRHCALEYDSLREY